MRLWNLIWQHSPQVLVERKIAAIDNSLTGTKQSQVGKDTDLTTRCNSAEAAAQQ